MENEFGSRLVLQNGFLFITVGRSSTRWSAISLVGHHTFNTVANGSRFSRGRRTHRRSRRVIRVLSVGRVAPSRSRPRGLGYPFQFRPPQPSQIYPSAWNHSKNIAKPLVLPTLTKPNGRRSVTPAISPFQMPWPGLEPGRLTAPPPQDGVSTISTTRAGEQES